MAKKITINGENLLNSLNNDWGGVNSTQSSESHYGTLVPAGAEWGVNRGEVERFIKDSMKAQQNMVGYFVCASTDSTSAKIVVASGYQLASGGCVRIKMTNANTANNVTLNINSTGAKALFYDGAQASSSNTWEAGEVLEVYYDGTQYQCASSGGGGKFATGEKVNDTSITNTIAEGSSALPTSGAVFEKTKAIDKIAGRVPPAYTSGKYLNGSGVPVSNASWKVIDFLNVHALAAGDVLVWGGITKNPSACICFYDENGTFKNAKSATGTSRTITLGSSDAALGSVKIRASFLESGTPSLTLNGSDVIAANTHYQITGLTELQEDVEALNEEVPKLIEFDEAAAELVYNMVDYDTWDTSGTSGTRVKFIYRNILGATVKAKCESGYSFGISYYAGSNPSGSALYDTGWKTEETTVNVPASGVGSLTINTRKSNNTAITYDESIANVFRDVYIGTRKVSNEAKQGSGDMITSGAVFNAVNGNGDYSYYGERIKLTNYHFDGQFYMTIRHPSADTSGQGAGIYGNYFIQGGNGGYVRVYDLITKEVVVDSMALGSVDANNHVNNIVFGKTIPDGGTFPYMYVSECVNQRRCFVENFTLSGSTLVQTLEYNDSNMKDSNWVVDNEGGYMYLIGNYINSDTVRVIKLPFVEPTSGNHTYTPSDIIEYFDLDGSVGKAYVFQGNVIKDGKLYSCFGGSGGTHRVWINDLDSHKLLNVIELDQITRGECENINLYNGTMMIGYPNQSKLYQLIF